MRARAAVLLAALVAPIAAASARAGDGGPPAPPPAPPPLECAFLPTADLRVPEHLAAHPEADGRGVVVAILDTGVDPGHPRLSTTSTGEPKLLDFLDATDDGIVDTSLPLEAVDGVVTGSTGRVLTLGAHAKPGDGSTLGRIDARDVLPEELVRRLVDKRRARHAEAVRRAREAGGPPSRLRPGETAEAADARRASEVEARDALADDVPAFDVLVVKKPDGPRVVIDTDGDGDLAEEREIGDFGRAREWVTLGDDVAMNVGVRPDQDGRHVRLLFDGGGHGTHVAGIATGFDGPGSALNGVAPGARVLAIKIGNSRWGGPTTNLAILRALDWAGQRGAGVVNVSFGGSTFSGNEGTPDARAADEAVERHGLVCCFSAGNEGPALSTIGSPATARRTLSVGAFVSPATMKVCYAQLGPDPGERLFGFSSRGPLPGGDLGISVVAPGSAWSALPSWHLVRADNWNGTSMAAPEVAGVAALLLSGAKQAKVPAPPARVIRALLSTARPVEGLSPLEQGAGLVQADRAYEALLRMREAPEERPLRARVVNPTGVGGGVHERGTATEPFERRVRVTVDWRRDATNEARAAYERRLTLSADAPWVETTPRLALNADGGSFTVRVDPTALPPGLHVARVRAIDPAREADGPELVVPVTLIVPEAADPRGGWHGKVDAAPGERVARYLRVPHGASTVRLRVASRAERKASVTAVLSTLDAWRRQEDRVAQRRFDLLPGGEQELESPAVAGATVEVVLFCAWNSEGPAAIDASVRFEGPSSPDAEVRAGPGEDVAMLRVQSPLAPFHGRVVAKVTHAVERPEVSKEVTQEPGGPVLGRDPLFTATQRFRLVLGAGEGVTVVPLGTRALDEQREDARWRVVDAAGRIVRRAVIDGNFDVDGLPAGAYEVVYETPTWGRAAADAGLTGFSVRRAVPEGIATVYPTADMAADGTGADADLDLPAGAFRSVALRLPWLEAGRLYTGVVEVRDERDKARLSVPLWVDRRTDPAWPTAAAEDRLVRALREAAQAVADVPASGPDAVREALQRARRALALRPADRDLDVLVLRLLVRLSADTALRKEAVEKADALVDSLDRAKGEDRPRLGRVLVARGALARLSGKPAQAAGDLSEGRFLLPDSDPDVLAERVARGRAAGGDGRDGLAAARALRDAAPTEFEASKRVLDALLDLGWGAAAGVEVRGWRERFPGRTSDVVAAARRVRTAGGDPAPRTLAAVEAGAP